MTALTTDAPARIESRPPLALAAVAYAMLVAWVTLGPQSDVSAVRAIVQGYAEHALLPLLPFSPLSLLLSERDFEAAANVLMFVPFGILAALWSPRSSWFGIATIGVAASGAIEVAQFFLPGRVSDLGDVIANGAGAALGALLIVSARALDRWTPRNP